jgi:single-stranded DNA-binding protein
VTIECAFTGVLGRDAEVKTSGKGRSYLKLNIRAGDGDDTCWVSTLSFDPDAVEQAASFVKGAKVYVEGRISLNEWEDQSGGKRTGLSAMVNFSRLVAIGRHRARDQDEGKAAAAQRRDEARRHPNPDIEDEIPF